ncbi:hypothetical protein M3P21_07375 [Ruegeria sp. 2012CJ41-6]|uniref:Uncharacterized protein n=1 Tax=Ruegeria spongiae TaxID=2942209 RepID=A0ABT0Q0E5_9RHOB|nr:hypothetical protein [Ruegeria spongiae]MCL6283351.1 hypothetical protein [Ruegeria spongiae]
MKSKGRYIALTVSAVSAGKFQLPWARGARRARMIARRAERGSEVCEPALN